MRIGILTQHLSKNYGGIIQNWALQQVLLAQGHEPLTFEHDTCYSRSRWLLRTVKQVLLKRTFSSLPEYPYRGRVGHKSFINFIIKNIRSVTVYDFSPELVQQYACSVFIVGSDQVWRPAFNQGRLYNMFLDFTGDNIKKIAYAASFGVSEWEYTEEETKKCRMLANRFDAISVREDSAVTLCNEHLGVKAKWVLDPTLLLNKENYLTLCQDVTVSKDTIFVYALHLTDDIINYANKLAGVRGGKVTIMQAGDKLNKEDCIEKWIAAFRDANSVVTDSFHGMAFSIIFNKPFHIFKNKSGGIARYISLLQQFGLTNRIIENPNVLQTECINWDNVNRYRENIKQVSLNFLIQSLKK